MMTQVLKRGNLSVKKSPIHGYGVFADQDFKAGEIIEESYVLCVSENVTDLRDYFFSIAEASGLALGSGSIFNHSETPNADYHYEPERQVLVFKAEHAIARGKEIFIDYGEKWFSSRKATPVKQRWRSRIKRPGMMVVRFGFVMVVMLSLLAIVNHFTASARLSFTQISSKQIQKQSR